MLWPEIVDSSLRCGDYSLRFLRCGIFNRRAVTRILFPRN